jgi:hypothetical protein
LLSVLPYNCAGRLKANADGAALVDKGTLGGNPPYDILGGQYRRHPATTLRHGRDPVLNLIDGGRTLWRRVA